MNRPEKLTGLTRAVLTTVDAAPRPLPLVVDLDGTLVRSDLLIETAFSELARRPRSALDMLSALTQGKAALKHRLATPARFDPATLPYDDEVLAAIRQARAEGRPVYLASASNERLVSAVADHLGLFEGWFGSDERVNLGGAAKANCLVKAFGRKGFDYIGNDAADLPVWREAAKIMCIRAPRGVARRLTGFPNEVEHLVHERPTLRVWAKLIRVHQYAKNALVFVPLLTAHQFGIEAIGQAVLAFVAFSLCASSVYVLNDLVDLQDDRGHPRNCRRPLACGAIPLLHGVVAMPVLFLAALLIASLVSLPFLGVLLGYFAITTAYSFALKRMMLVDVITLAVLYSARVIGGAVAIGAPISHWLIAFCIALFTSLALVKRFVELNVRIDAKMPDPANRDYRAGDVGMVGALAAAAGFNAVTVFALYVSSTEVRALYTRPEVLWLACPLLLYWIARVLMLAQRRVVHDDPIVFAIKDKVSLFTMAAVGFIALAAI